MNTIVGIHLSDEMSEMNGIIIYLVYSNGKRVRLDVPEGSAEMYEDNGIPILR